jgi:TrpR-related protein YerC/YecD
MKKDKKINLDELYGAILQLKTLDEAKAFFRDLCTLEELGDMAERFEIAKLLSQGATYRDVSAKLKVSTTTVSRVAQWLFNGEGGYRTILDRMHHHNPSFEKRL